jgi:hypothetical protein
MLDGGAMCERCRQGKRQIVGISRSVLRLLEKFAEAETEDWRTAELNQREFGELRGVLNKYLSHLLGHAPKMHKLLGPMAS